MSIVTLKDFSVKVKDDVLLDKWSGEVVCESEFTEAEAAIFIGGLKQYVIRTAVIKGFEMPEDSVRLSDILTYIEENVSQGGGIGARIRALKAKLFDAVMNSVISPDRGREIHQILEANPDEDTVKELQEELKASFE